MTLRIRDALQEDGAALAAIYGPVVRDTAISFEIDPPDGREMARRIGDTPADLPFLVAETASGGVAGYAYAGRYRTRPAYRRTVEVSLYVAEDGRGQGVGRALYAALLERLAANGFNSALAIIVVPNGPSVSFHEAMGFKPRGVLHEVGFKFGQWHDAGFWQRKLPCP